MGTLRSSLPRSSQLIAAGHPQLPGGIRQVDCDGPPDRWLNAGGAQLWNACDPSQQELISVRFVEIHSDLLRDSLLDIQDALYPLAARPNQNAAALLGGLLRSKWICFRDQMLREMHHRGELPRT